MKTIIISDIRGDSESIIPYGLQFGKYTETNVDIIHIIDPRSKQGVSSSFADSKTITPGKKLTHHEILEREKGKVHAALDKLLSRETSSLNYPLRVNTIVEANNVYEAFNAVLKKSKDQMIIINRKIESTFLENYAELFNITKDHNSLIMSVPPGLEFSKPAKALYVNDFTEDPNKKIQLLFNWLSHFNIYFNATRITKMNQLIESELSMEAWKTAVSKFSHSPAIIKINTIQGKNFKDTLLNYSKRNGHDLIILQQNEIKPSVKKMVLGNETKELLEELKKAVILC